VPRLRTEDRKGYPLRLPPELYESLTEAAVEDERSINGEVITALRDWLKARKARRKGGAANVN
jgi:hypothetical protein